MRSGDRRIIAEYMVGAQPIRRVSEVGDEVPLHVGSSGRTIVDKAVRPVKERCPEPIVFEIFHPPAALADVIFVGLRVSRQM